MGLPTSYTQAFGAFEEFFARIRDAQAPVKFTQQILKDWGYKSNNHRPFIPLLKSLGFLSPDGTPTQRYHEYRNHAKSKEIMGQALKEAYSDIFLIKAHPTSADKDLIQGKFKSYHNASDNVARLHTNTFYSLLELADLSSKSEKATHIDESKNQEKSINTDNQKTLPQLPAGKVGLHYNIQIHLPATKDVEVYNAIFKSLKEHLID
ncbi:DUF5343 domain-containing protein [Kangiella koreensis]|uniref:DUF5343 domain-containing protein n=1 Tax=Kangiella koreensis (strain DSM 16069 / JCM 12317 / KCTC 12182 / SW-125) TaxID=523791 RepID=C7RBC8_KANKD|nr:DUF5343 domain-containing protein [Kangiella koreensis]ACV26570.1 conserved hypothetical protein [Kangiella koreensis DSM 16069]